ncbi:hypothetical protein [Leucobacter exalbidus]|nr:hypothetical protein [Leucobacter exalbidus]
MLPAPGLPDAVAHDGQHGLGNRGQGDGARWDGLCCRHGGLVAVLVV